MTNTAAAVGSLNVGDASKVYGQPAQVSLGACFGISHLTFLGRSRWTQYSGLSNQGNTTSTIRPSMGATIMNPVLTQQFIGGKWDRE